MGQREISTYMVMTLLGLLSDAIRVLRVHYKSRSLKMISTVIREISRRTNLLFDFNGR